MKKKIQTDKAPKAIGPYSQAIQAGNIIFCSGQIPIDPASGELIKGNVKEQTVRVMENLEAVLVKAGATFKNVVKTTIFLIDLANFSDVNEIYAKYFDDIPPARATVQVAKLPRDVDVEIDAIAVLN